MRVVDGMLCPICESGHLKEIRKDVPFDYKGHTHVVSNVRAYDCDTCGESLWDDRHEREIERSLTDVRRRIDGLLTSDEIRKIRQFFKMTQVQFAAALGVGEKNFARYESGQSSQSRAMDHLLRILRDFPQAMQVIHRDWAGWASEKQEITVPIRRRRSKGIVATLDTENCQIEDEGSLDECAVSR